MPINANIFGSWSATFSWPLIGLSATMTPDGKILTFGTDQLGAQSGLHVYDIWDPVTNIHTTLQHTTQTDLFCATSIIDPSTGNVIFVGGDARPIGNYNSGVSDVNEYDYRNQSLTHSSTGPMAYARWYATSVELGNGQIAFLGGRDGSPGNDFHNSAYSEIYTPGYGFRTLTGAYIDDFNIAALYPRSWLKSDGHIWTSSDGSSKVYSIDPSGNGSVALIGAMPTAISFSRPSIMYGQDKVLLIGNDGSAWTMDLSGAVPVYQRTADVGPGRIWSNLTVLPDGRVMISGGSAVDLQLVGVNNTVEIWDPKTGQWTVEADAAVPRLYHSTTMLLADGRVVSLGGGAPGPVNNTNGEIYSPDYLFDVNGAAAPRPVIVDAPKDLDVGQLFTIHVANPAAVTTLVLMPFTSVTHSFNMTSQRLEMPFTVQADGSLKADLPDNANVLKPGYWMLFALDNKGTPSVAATIQIHSELPQFFPAVQHLIDDRSNFQFQTNIDAAYDGYNDVYVLTPDAPTKVGSVMSTERIDVSKPFEFAFEINVGANDAGADGMAFVLHNAAAGATAIGGRGGALGAQNIANGLAIKFDTFQNVGDPGEIATDHTNFLNTASGAIVSPTVSLGNIEDGNWHKVDVKWNGTTLSYTFDGVAAGTLTQNIAANYFGGSQFAYFGFTGATGGLTESSKVRIDLIKATFEDGTVVLDDRANVPLNPIFVTHGNALAEVGRNTFTVTPDKPQQVGSVMLDTRVDLTKSFDVTFEINVGANNNGADGMAFVLHNDARGLNALGGAGGAMGAMNLQKGLAIQFDTFQNAGDPNDIANDHTSFVNTATEQILSPIRDLGNIEDGKWHSVHVNWSGTALSYTVDGVAMGTLAQNLGTTYFGGSQFAYLGFTGATGGLSEHEQVRILRLDATAEGGKSLHLVGPNKAPVAGNDTYAVAAGAVLTIDAAHGVIANDSDPDRDPLKICVDSRVIPHTLLLQPDNGSVVMNLDGSFVYTPNAGFVGVDHFNYCVEDGPACTQGLVTINVQGGAGVAPTFQVAGSAIATAGQNTFIVTPDAPLQVGGVVLTKRIDFTKALDLTFEINVGANNNGADGMAFVMHNDSRGATALGGLGGAFGALNLDKGLAIQFDTYQNAGDPNDIANDHTSFINTKTEALVSPVRDLGNIEDGNWHSVHVTWDGAKLAYSMDGVAISTLTQNLSTTYFGGSQFAYLGFTGATGGLSEMEQVRIVSFTGTAEDGTYFNTNATNAALNTITGTNADETLNGTANSDQILGLNGNDTLLGNGGNDVLNGGQGADLLTGGAGNDKFVFKPGFGNDTITDFSRGAGNHDVIDLTGFGFASAGDALIHAFGVGANTVFTLPNGDSLTINNTAAGNITNLIATDFLF